MTSVKLKNFRGLNNRARDTDIPQGAPENPGMYLRNAVNVDFNSDKSVSFPRMGFTQVYSGTQCRSWYEYEHYQGKGLFVEGTYLKRLNSDNTATTLKTVGSEPMSYCRIENTVYFSNGTVTGKYVDGNLLEWGIDVPPTQPQVSVASSGGMYAGDYQVAITWLVETTPEHYEESGTFGSTRIAIAEGQGVRLTSFPTPPSYVSKVAVYISDVNSDDLYLHGEYPADVQEVFIDSYIGTIRLETQFAVKPKPLLGLVAHYGRIYWIDGNLVRYTEAQSYDLQRVNSFLPFEEPVTNIVSVPGTLYVTTEKGIFEIMGVDTEQLSKVRRKDYGAVAGATHTDIDNSVYVASYRGIIRITAEGVSELGFESVAFPKFQTGTIAVIEDKGNRRVVTVGQSGEVSDLQDSGYTDSEIARHGTAL